MKLSVGIDCGTSFVKSVLFDPCGRVLDSVGERFENLQSEELWLEQDMSVIWVKTLSSLSTLLKRNSEVMHRIRCIGITSHGDGLWMMDASGSPVRNGIYWCDGRARAEVESLYKSGRAADAFDICGTSLFTGSQPMILQWLMVHEPESIERSAAILHCKDWIFYKMTGVVSSDDTD